MPLQAARRFGAGGSGCEYGAKLWNGHKECSFAHQSSPFTELVIINLIISRLLNNFHVFCEKNVEKVYFWSLLQIAILCKIILDICNNLHNQKEFPDKMKEEGVEKLGKW